MQIVDKTMSDLFSNSYSSAIITLFLVLYGGLAAPKLPSFVADLFENPVFRIIVLSLIVYKGQRDPAMALMIGIGFTVTLNMINKQKFFENMTSITTVPSCQTAKDMAKKTGLPVSMFEYLCNKNINQQDGPIDLNYPHLPPDECRGRDAFKKKECCSFLGGSEWCAEGKLCIPGGCSGTGTPVGN
jgi:hypothetical protein